MYILRALVKILPPFLAIVGVVLTFASSYFDFIPEGFLPWSDDPTRLLGLLLFMFAVIANMLYSQWKESNQDAAKPKLSLGDSFTIDKEPGTGKGKDRISLGKWRFLIAEIINQPNDLDNGQSAEKATAELVYTTENGEQKRIRYGRWWDREDALLLDKIFYGVRFLKQVDIGPGHPETLVLAYKKKRGRTIYAYHFNDHQRFWEILSKRKLGKPPITVAIHIRGRFRPVKFECIIDIDKAGQFTLIEKPHDRSGFIAKFRSKS